MPALQADEVRPGIWAIPMPMPGPLARTYVYALDAGGSVLLVDAGWDGVGALRLLESSLRTIGWDLSDISGVILTHGHPDHYGLANAIRAESGAWIALHRKDARYTVGPRDTSPLEAWLVELGVDSREAQATIGLLSAWRSPDLTPDRFPIDASVIVVGERRLEVVHTPGHSPGHICLVDHANKVVFTGDHVLSWTTPNVSVHLDEPGSPLNDYLASLERMLPLEGFVALPGHEERVPVAPRAAEILAHHAEQLDCALSIIKSGDEIVAAIAARMPWTRAWEELGPMDRFLACGETLAHLRVLESRGQAEQHAISPQRWRPTERST